MLEMETQDRYLEGSTNIYDEIGMILKGEEPYAQKKELNDNPTKTKKGGEIEKKIWSILNKQLERNKLRLPR